MAKYKRSVMGVLLLVVLVPLVYIGSIVTMNWITLQYGSHRLEIDAENWAEAYQAFELSFQPGMTRQEVIDTLMEIDPNMSKDDFVSAEEVYGKHSCQVRSDNRCTERVLVFRNTPLLALPFGLIMLLHMTNKSVWLTFLVQLPLRISIL